MSLKAGNYRGFVYETGQKVVSIESAISTLQSDVVDASGVVVEFKAEFQDLSAQVQVLVASMVVVENRLDVMDASMVEFQDQFQVVDASMVEIGNSLEDLSGSVNTEFLKTGFIIVGEAEGVLTLDSYPFCFGAGVPQEAGFGVSIPFRAKLKNLSLVKKTLDNAFLVRIQMIHYSYETNIATTLGEEYSFQASRQIQLDITTPGNGHIVFKVTFIRAPLSTDKFRLSLVFSADENLYLT
jgi:hypothetical protein